MWPDYMPDFDYFTCEFLFTHFCIRKQYDPGSILFIDFNLNIFDEKK